MNKAQSLPIRFGLIPIVFLFGLLLSSSSLGQATQAPKLDEKAVLALLSQLEESLSVQIDDEPLVEQIVDKWREHDDLIGKPRLQVLKLLFADVQAAINDKDALAAIWASWTGERSDPKL